MSDELDAILDGCLEDIAAGRETIASCLRRYPAQAEQLAVLLKTAEHVRAASPPAPMDIDKRLALESRLLQRAEHLRLRAAQRPAARPVPAWRRRFAVVAASFAMIVVLIGSAVSASASTMPGDVLYPVKRAVEQVRLTFAAEHQQTDLHVEFARRRLREFRVLAERGELATDLLDEISGETTAVLQQVPALPQDRQQAVLTSLVDFQDQQEQVLKVIASSAQGDAQARVMTALADSEAKRKQVADLLGRTAPPGDSPANVSPPPAAGGETQPAPAKPTVKPVSPDRPSLPDPRATIAPPATARKPTPKAEHTPPGQADKSTPHAPPGQVDKATPHAPPGQANKSIPHAPPGQGGKSKPHPLGEKPTKAPKP